MVRRRNGTLQISPVRMDWLTTDAILRDVNAAKRKLSDRAGKILTTLHATYPDAECALHHANPLQLLIATILSAQCTDERVNMVTPALFKRYRAAADFAAAP